MSKLNKQNLIAKMSEYGPYTPWNRGIIATTTTITTTTSTSTARKSKESGYLIESFILDL